MRAGGEREKKIGSIGTLAGADTVNLPRANRIACPRSVGHSVADRFIPCRISRAPSSDAVIRTTVLSVAGMGWSGEKKMICRGYLFIFFFIYNYVLFGFVYDKLSRIILNHFVSTYLKMINARRLTNKLLGTNWQRKLNSSKWCSAENSQSRLIHLQSRRKFRTRF